MAIALSELSPTSRLSLAARAHGRAPRRHARAVLILIAAAIGYFTTFVTIAPLPQASVVAGASPHR